MIPVAALLLLGSLVAAPAGADTARIDAAIETRLIQRSAEPREVAEERDGVQAGGGGGGAGAGAESRMAGAADSQDPTHTLNVTIHFIRPLEPGEVVDLEAEGITFHRLPDGTLARFGRFYPASISESALGTLAEDPRVEYVESGRDEHARLPLDESRVEVQADLRNAAVLGDDPFRRNRGNGVVITDFDSGIDVFHPEFFFVDDSVVPYEWIDVGGNGVFDTGVDRVDLDRDGVGQPDETLVWWSTSPPSPFTVDTRFNYWFNDANGNGVRDFGPAAGYTEADPTYGELVFIVIDHDGDHDLGPGDQLVPLGPSKIRATMDVDGNTYYRGVNLIDTPADPGSHGTSVASILVGQTPDYGRRAVGIAPDAELIMIDQSVGKNGGPYNRLSALSWARSQGTDVVLWEFGSWIGQFLDGSSALEQVISQLSESQDSVHVIPNGNVAAAGRHAQVTLDPAEEVVLTLSTPLAIGPTKITFTALWRADITAIDVSFRAAGAPAFSQMPSLPAAVQLDATHRIVSARSLSSRGTGRWDGQLDAGGAAIDNTLDWEVRLVNDRSFPITVHVYANDDATAWSGGVEWLDHVSTSHTVTWPATADTAINVGSYALDAPETGALSDFSGRGPRIDGFDELLDVTAPGDDDIATATSVDWTGRWANYRWNFGGTSAAGPHVAGAVALLLESVPLPSVDDVTLALQDSALKDGFTGPGYGQEWGHGKLRIEDAYWLLADRLCTDVGEPAGAFPANGAVGQDTGGVLLGWSAAPTGQNYDVYFGTTSPPPLAAAGLTTPSWATGPLDPEQQYHWQVVARNDCGDTGGFDAGGVSRTGPAWTFTTDAADASGIAVFDEGFGVVPDGGTFVLPPKSSSPRDYLFRIQSTGTAPLSLINATTPVFLNDLGPTFEIVSQPVTSIPPGALTSFVLRVHPNGGVADDVDVFIPNDTPNGAPFTFTVELPAEAGMELQQSGDVLPPGTEGDETVFQVPTTPVGESELVFFQIHPSGGAPLELLGTPPVALAGEHAGDYAVTVQPSPTTITGGHVAFVVEFTPSEGGPRHASLNIETNVPGAPVYSIDLVGVGVGCEPETDADCDGVADAIDNCPRAFNPPQTDRDGDGLGDECIVLEVGRYDPVVTAPVHVVGDVVVAPRGAPGVTLLDVSDPSAPQEILTVDPGFTSAARLLPDQRIVSTSASSGVTLLDPGNPGSPVIDTLPLDFAGRIVTDGDVGYVLGTGDFYTLDLSSATGPAILDTYLTPGSTRSLDVFGDRAYVGESPGTLLVLDVSDPADVQLLGSFTTTQPIEGVTVAGDVAYAAVGIDGFVILDVSNPAAIVQLGGADTEEAEDVEIEGDLLFVADDFFGHLRVFDVSVPAAPVFVAQIDQVDYPRQLERDADHLYVSDADLRIFDLHPDNDGDGLEDRTEKQIGSGVLDPDSDGDGLSDGDEVLIHGTLPTQADTDGDGIDDPTEIFGPGTDPLLADTDTDGVDDDGDNCPLVANGPLAGPNDQLDTDGDGLGDVCDPTPVPEPGIALLRVAGLLGLAWLARLRARVAARRRW